MASYGLPFSLSFEEQATFMSMTRGLYDRMAGFCGVSTPSWHSFSCGYWGAKLAHGGEALLDLLWGASAIAKVCVWLYAFAKLVAFLMDVRATSQQN